MIKQLYENNCNTGDRTKLSPVTEFEAVKDENGNNLTTVVRLLKNELAKSNHYYLSPASSVEDMRLQLPSTYRRKGIVVTYIYNDAIKTEIYSSDSVSDESFKDSRNWRAFTSAGGDSIDAEYIAKLEALINDYNSLDKDYQQYKEYATAEHTHINEKLENIDEVKDVVHNLTKTSKICTYIDTTVYGSSTEMTIVPHFLHLDAGGISTTGKIILRRATHDYSGVMTPDDKIKLDSLTIDQNTLQNSIKHIYYNQTNTPYVYFKYVRNDNTTGEFSIPPVSSSYPGILSTTQFNNIPWITNGKIPSRYLPDHLDDIIEYDTKEVFPIEGEKGVLYVALDTNHFYRWSGSSYIDMSDVNGGTTVEFGETKGTAYEGDKGKKNADDIAEINSTRVITNIDNRIVNADSIVLPVTGKQIDGADIVTSNITFPLANYNSAGLLSPSHKAKLDRLEIVPNLTNITITNAENGLNINYDSYNLNTGVTSEANINIPSVTTTTAGVMTAADKVNLNNLVSNKDNFTQSAFIILYENNNWVVKDENEKVRTFGDIKLGDIIHILKESIEPIYSVGIAVTTGTISNQVMIITPEGSYGFFEKNGIRQLRFNEAYDIINKKGFSTNNYTNNDKNTVTNLSNSLVKDITNTFSRTGGTLGFKVLTPNNGSYNGLNFSIPLASDAGNNGSGLISNVQYQKLESIPDINTIVTTDSNGKIPNDLLPSYVSDILEYSNKDAFPTTGTTGKIYVDIATNKTYRWSGTQYTLIGDGTGISVTGKLINATSGTATYKRNSGTVNIPIKDASTSTESNFTIPLKGADETYAGLFAANDKKKLNGIIKNTHTLNASIDNESGATFTWQEQVNNETNNWQATSNQFNIPIVSDTSAGLVTKDMLNSNSGTDIRNIQLELVDDYNGNITIKNSSFTPNLGDFVTVTVLDSNDNVINNHEYNGVYQVVVHKSITNKITTKLFGSNGVIDINKINNTTTIKYSTIRKGKTVNASIDYNSAEFSDCWIIDEDIDLGDILHIKSSNSNVLDGKLSGQDVVIIGKHKSASIWYYTGIVTFYDSTTNKVKTYIINYIGNGSYVQNSYCIDVNSSLTAAEIGYESSIDFSNNSSFESQRSVAIEAIYSTIKLHRGTLDATTDNLTYVSLRDSDSAKCLVTPRLINRIIKLIQDTETKLDNFLTNTDATDEAISSWAEIQNFLDGIKDTDTLTGIKTSILNDAKSYVDNKNFITSSSLTKSSVGLGNVDNTSDLAKPVSTATQNALNNKVDKVAGKGLSTNDFTNALKTKLEGLSSSGSGNNYYIANIVDNKLVIGGNDIKNIINNGDAFYIEDEKVVSDTNVFQSNWIVVSIEGDSVDSYSIVALGNRGELLYTVNGGTPTWTINSSFVRKISGKGLSSNDYTNADKNIITSLNDISEVSIGVRRITALADKVSIDDTMYAFNSNEPYILSTDIPAASTTKAGVMTADDKSKLDNLGNVKALTTAQYDALTTKDSNTIYFLTD